MTTVINLHGGPGTGKSTSAAYLFYALKKAGKNAELVREYVKDWAWEKRHINAYDQLYFLGKQSRKESMLYGKVDLIVTDSPIWLSAYYAQVYCPLFVSEGVRAATVAYYHQASQDGHVHHHVNLKRTKEYNPAGRFQTEEQARELDGDMARFLKDVKVKAVECGTENVQLDELLVKLGILQS
jgi:tRNA uridine 5-carbamoylmethylation protein Kti12